MMESNRELNLNVKSESGWCLWFTQEVFRVPHLYPSATSAWNATKFRHYDRNLPNAPVPIWFELWGNYGTPTKYDNWGHVATWVPGKGILSSPVTFRTTGQQWFGSIDELIRAMRGGRYLGWSEDISGIRIVREATVKPNKEQVIEAFNRFNIKLDLGEQLQYYLARESGVLYRDLINATTPAQAEIVGIFKSVLGREPSKDQITYYSNRLSSVLYSDVARASVTERPKVDGFTEADRETVKQTNSLVQTLVTWFKKIFRLE